MADKTMNLGNSSTTVNLNVTGTVVGSNIKSKGNSTTPIYFDANGVAQTVTSVKITSDTALSKTSTNPVQNKVIATAIDELITISSGTNVVLADMDDIANLQSQITALKNRLDSIVNGDEISY